MPAKKNQQTDFSNLTNIIQAKFPNLLLGLTVIVALLLVVSFFTDGQLKDGTKKISWNIFNRKEMKEEGSKKDVNVYTVKAGDHLWSIAENAYGSGYNAYDIAKANNLSNPSLVEVGQKLKLPLVEAKIP
ncbi:MAG: LysM domain-containing protein, partial [Patescibacteria group bacterium]